MSRWGSLLAEMRKVTVLKSPQVRSTLTFLGKIVLIEIGLLGVNALIACLAGQSREDLGSMLFISGVLVFGLGASRLVTRWDRPTSPEAMLGATTEESTLREILRRSRREDRADLSFFCLMGSAGLVCVLLSLFFS